MGKKCHTYISPCDSKRERKNADLMFGPSRRNFEACVDCANGNRHSYPIIVDDKELNEEEAGRLLTKLRKPSFWEKLRIKEATIDE